MITDAISTSELLIKTLNELPSTIENLLLLLSEKEKFVIVRRFDLDNQGKATLEDIGENFVITRERVRQIEKNALSKMRRNVFNTQLDSIYSFAEKLLKDSGGLIREKHILNVFSTLIHDADALMNSRIHLSLVLNDDFICMRNTIHYFPFVKSSIIPEFSLKFISSHIINELNKHGEPLSIDVIFNSITTKLENDYFTAAFLKSLVDVDKRLSITDDKVALVSWRHVHPRTLRDKILFVLHLVKKPVHFREITELIRTHGFDDRDVNLQAVHNELIRHDQFILIGRGIYALSDWGYEKGTVADVIIDFLKGCSEKSQDDIIAHVLTKRLVKKITVILALKNNLLFERVGRKHYRLKESYA